MNIKRIGKEALVALTFAAAGAGLARFVVVDQILSPREITFPSGTKITRNEEGNYIGEGLYSGFGQTLVYDIEKKVSPPIGAGAGLLAYGGLALLRRKKKE